MGNKFNRRDLLKTTLAGAGIVLGSSLLSGKWSRPVMAAGGLPAHAKASTLLYDLAWDDVYNVLVAYSSGSHQVIFQDLFVYAYDTGTENPVDGVTVTLTVTGNDGKTYTLIDADPIATAGTWGADFKGGGHNPTVSWATGDYWNFTVTASATGAADVTHTYVSAA